MGEGAQGYEMHIYQYNKLSFARRSRRDSTINMKMITQLRPSSGMNISFGDAILITTVVGCRSVSAPAERRKWSEKLRMSPSLKSDGEAGMEERNVSAGSGREKFIKVANHPLE